MREYPCIVEFLTARYDELEAAIRRAEGYGGSIEVSERLQLTDSVSYAPDATEALKAYVRAVAPHRMLPDLAAKRRMLKLHFPMILHKGGGADWYDTTRVCGSCVPPRQFPETAWPCLTARAMAAPYAEHPDFNPDWRVTM
jgi:hypothetical protein